MFADRCRLVYSLPLIIRWGREVLTFRSGLLSFPCSSPAMSTLKEISSSACLPLSASRWFSFILSELIFAFILSQSCALAVMPMLPTWLAIFMLALWWFLLKSILPEMSMVSSRESMGVSSLSLPSRLLVINLWSFLFVCNRLISMVYCGSLLNSLMNALHTSSIEPLLCIFRCGTFTHASIPYMLASIITGMSA